MSTSRRPTGWKPKPETPRWSGPDPGAATINESEQTLNGQGQIHHANRAAHQQARERLVHLIRALHLVSRPEIESEVQIWDNLPRAADWASRTGGPIARAARRLVPPSVTTTEWAHGRLSELGETRFEVTDTTSGWVFPHALGGSPKPGSRERAKYVPKKYKEQALIIANDTDAVESGQLPRSYVGGHEKFDGGPREGQGFSSVIATGSTLASNERSGGYHGHNALDSLIDYRDLGEISHKTSTAWGLGNLILARGALLKTNPKDPHEPNPMEAHLPPLPLATVPANPHDPNGVDTQIHPYLLPEAPGLQYRPIPHALI